jgi:hypothetical protein
MVEHGWHCLQTEEDDPSGDTYSVWKIADDCFHVLKMMMMTVDSYLLCQTSRFKRHNEVRIRYV